MAHARSRSSHLRRSPADAGDARRAPGADRWGAVRDAVADADASILSGTPHFRVRSNGRESSRATSSLRCSTCELANDTVVQPDIMIILADRSIDCETGDDRTPESLVEIISSCDSTSDRTSNAKIYRSYGFPSIDVMRIAGQPVRSAAIPARVDTEVERNGRRRSSIQVVRLTHADRTVYRRIFNRWILRQTSLSRTQFWDRRRFSSPTRAHRPCHPSEMSMRNT